MKSTSHRENSFTSVIKASIGIFLNRTIISKEKILYTLFNPSITDFVLSNYLNNTKKILNILKALQSIESINMFFSLSKSDMFSLFLYSHKGAFLKEQIVIKISNQVLVYALNKNLKTDYILNLLNLRKDSGEENPDIKSFLQNIINQLDQEKLIFIQEFSAFLNLLLKFHKELDLKDFSFLERLIRGRGLNEIELEDTMRLLDYLSVENEEVLEAFKENVIEFLKEKINEKGLELDFSKVMEFVSNDDNNERYIEIDEGTLNEELFSIVESSINSFDPLKKLDQKIEIDIGKIIDCFDKDKAIEIFKESLTQDLYEKSENPAASFDQDIDYIFSRH